LLKEKTERRRDLVEKEQNIWEKKMTFLKKRIWENSGLGRIAMGTSLIMLFLILPAAVYADGKPPGAVPVIPNESLITGRILSYAVVSSELLMINRKSSHETRGGLYVKIYELKILIEESEDLAGLKNFTKDKVGTIITAYTKKVLGEGILNRRIKARVSLRGDEWGSHFWIRGDVELMD
jgi:hypothetical protein